MNWKISNLGFHNKWFLCSLHSLIFKHILHASILMTIYDLVSNVTIDVTRISHVSLYFQLLRGNLRNRKNRFFLSFDFTCFNIVKRLAHYFGLFWTVYRKLTIILQKYILGNLPCNYYSN
jgi:hypothetical protein